MAVDDSGVLATFEGRDVIEFTAALKGAGDGLSKAVSATNQRALKVGDEGCIVFRYVVEAVDHKAVKGTKTLKRHHVLMAGTSTLIDDATVEKALAEQEERNRKAEELRKGIEPIAGFQEPDHAGERKRRRAPASSNGTTSKPRKTRAKKEAAAGVTSLADAKASRTRTPVGDNAK